MCKLGIARDISVTPEERITAVQEEYNRIAIQKGKSEIVEVREFTSYILESVRHNLQKLEQYYASALEEYRKHMKEANYSKMLSSFLSSVGEYNITHSAITLKGDSGSNEFANNNSKDFHNSQRQSKMIYHLHPKKYHNLDIMTNDRISFKKEYLPLFAEGVSDDKIEEVLSTLVTEGKNAFSSLEALFTKCVCTMKKADLDLNNIQNLSIEKLSKHIKTLRKNVTKLKKLYISHKW